MKKNFIILIISALLISAYLSARPKLTLVLVLDGCGHALMQKTLPYMHSGIKFLHNNGIVYSNAFQPHGMPETAVGHTAIGTGALAKDHGIVGNTWQTRDGKTYASDDDSAENAAVFSPQGLYDFGKSAKNIQVDTLADQIKLATNKDDALTVLSLSNKSRAAIGMGGRSAITLWFDDLTGLYTSSTAYMKELPQWVKTFNARIEKHRPQTIIWKNMYGENDPAYAFPAAENYNYSALNSTLLNKALPLGKDQKAPFYYFEKTPQANQQLLNFAYTGIKHYIKNNDILMYLSISNPDKMLHILGPNSKEAFDMMYQLDRQLGQFFKKIFKLIPQEDVLIIVTADHGFGSIFEVAHQENLSFARRLDEETFIHSLNTFLEKKYGINDIVKGFHMPYIYLNEERLDDLDMHLHRKIMRNLLAYLRSLPEIQDAWTIEEITKTSYSQDDARTYLKNQIFYERSGQIIVLMQPYNSIESYKTGTTHNVPYTYNTHVPLIWYQKGKHHHAQIHDRVYIQQIPVTLAELYHVPRPSAAFFDYLPGILPSTSVKSDAQVQQHHELSDGATQEAKPLDQTAV